jgi:hypothetical protein
LEGREIRFEVKDKRYAHENEMLGSCEVVGHSAKLVAVSKMGKEEETKTSRRLAVCVFEWEAFRREIRLGKEDVRFRMFVDTFSSWLEVAIPWEPIRFNT